MREVDASWIKKAGNIDTIAKLRQSTSSLKFALGPQLDRIENLDQEAVHFLVAADEDSPEYDRYADFVKIARMMGAPENVAEYAELQNDPRTMIFNSFYDKPQEAPIAPPIDIFHPAFQSFKSSVDDR
ncbi:hypothetical protein EUX98_g8937 [Antrodiella citrinella]|uniref:Uncharacterized protein n=1 Tax=Antrodiella citrinella TaxID=2447956 RepID=A0A4S4M221_9APHY|nr:hypothetical protein EUX98_g8937 [Antrodiella citrinella]